MAPDADPEVHRKEISLSKYLLITVLVSPADKEKIIELCRGLVNNDGVKSFIFCPGFGYSLLARIEKELGKDIAINISRGDGRSSRISYKEMKKAEWF